MLLREKNIIYLTDESWLQNVTLELALFVCLLAAAYIVQGLNYIGIRMFRRNP